MQNKQNRPLLQFQPHQHSPNSNPSAHHQHSQHTIALPLSQEDFGTLGYSKQLRLPLGQDSSDSQLHSVYMRCVTWSRDSHGLFDYESRYIAKRNIKTYTGGKIIRLDNDVEFINKALTAQEYNPNAKPLLVVNEKNGKYFVENDTLVSFTQQMQEDANTEKVIDEDVNNKMFIVVRNLKSSQAKNDYCLKKGDIIKLGRIKFKVKDFRTDLVPANLDNSNNRRASCSPVKQASKGFSQGMNDDEYCLGGDDFSEEAIEIDCGVVDATQSDIQCKVCWSNEQTAENPLLNSCKCDGSVRFIHYECLKHWLKQKMQKKDDTNIISYSWKQFECEICKKPYPYVFKSNNRKYRLVDVEVPEDRTFLWLESLTFEKNSSRMVHLVMPDKDRSTFKLGRGHESDVRVSDISVSRCHAILKYDSDHQFYLEDNLSKFGTLVLAKSGIELDSDQTVAVQIGRSVISFVVKPIQSEIGGQQSPIKPNQPVVMIKQTSTSVEEKLRQKIEETNQRINRLMQSALLSNGNQDEVQANNNNFNAYLQSTEDNRVPETSSQTMQRREVEEYNPERLQLSNTLLQMQQMEQRILNVEQRLAERDSGFKTLLQQSSPPRQNRNQYQDIEDEMLRNLSDNQKQIMNNERRYRQLQNIVQNPELDNYSADKMILSQVKPKASADSYQFEDLKEESFEEFVIQNEHSEEDDQTLRMKNADSEFFQHQFSQLSRDHTQDGMNRNSAMPTKQNTQYAAQWMNGAYAAENNLFSQIENQQDDSSSKVQHYYRAQTPEKVDFKNPSSQSISMKRSQTNFTGSQQSRYYQQQQQSPEKRYNHQMKYEQFGKANTTKQRDTQPLSSQSPFRMLSEDYDATSHQSNAAPQGLRTFKIDQSTTIYRNNGHTATNTQDKYSPIKRHSHVHQLTSTPSKSSKAQKDTSIGRSVANSSSYAQNSANRKRKSTATSVSGNNNQSTSLYSRQRDIQPQMRF